MKAGKDKAIGKIIDEEYTTPSGIVLTGEAVEGDRKGVRKTLIVDSNIPDLNAGDVGLYHRFSGTPFSYEGVNYIILDITDVVGVIEE